MGGGAFKQAKAPGQTQTLNTPRLSPAEYTQLKELYITKIKSFFASESSVHVCVLTEAPEKADYGDIDLCITSDERVDYRNLAESVQAYALLSRGPKKCSLGVRKDGRASSGPLIQYAQLQAGAVATAEVTEEEYAQIDIVTVPTAEIEWYMFYSSYGDLNTLLGHIVSPLGFVITDRGLWLRMRELETAKKTERCIVRDEEGILFLSRDSEQVMRFLGLSIEKWRAGFTTMNALYEWLSDCKLLHAETWRLKRDSIGAGDQKRRQQRTTYMQFFFEYIPLKMPNLDMETPVLSTTPEDRDRGATRKYREQHLKDALASFSKQDIYDMQHTLLVNKVSSAIASNLLRPIVAKHSGASSKKLSSLMTGFDRWVVFVEDGDGVMRPVVAETQNEVSQMHYFLSRDAEGERLRDEAEAEAFVERDWPEIRARNKAWVEQKHVELSKSGTGAVEEGQPSRAARRSID